MPGLSNYFKRMYRYTCMTRMSNVVWPGLLKSILNGPFFSTSVLVTTAMWTFTFLYHLQLNLNIEPGSSDVLTGWVALRRWLFLNGGFSCPWCNRVFCKDCCVSHFLSHPPIVCQIRLPTFLWMDEWMLQHHLCLENSCEMLSFPPHTWKLDIL